MQVPAHPSALPRFVALRVEAATLDGPLHAVAVGAVRVLDGEASDHFQALVRPMVPIEEAASAAHGIDDDAVRDAATGPEVLAELFDWLGDDWCAAHGAERDARILAFEAVRHGLTAPEGPLLDTRALAEKLVPEAYDAELDTLVEHLELEVSAASDGAGRTLARAVAAWQVLETCAERLADGGDVSLARLLDTAGARRTIASCAPDRPRKHLSQLRRLERARTTGSPVILHYGDRSEPPARLEVLPGVAYRQRDRAYLEGECLRTGTLKTYRLDRILRVEPVS